MLAIPYGKKLEPPASGAISNKLPNEKLPPIKAVITKKASTPSEMIAIQNAKVNETFTPAPLIAKKIT